MCWVHLHAGVLNVVWLLADVHVQAAAAYLHAHAAGAWWVHWG